ncbi:hypothetical protein PC128_g2336 [Phytophthora cactorum]|nr:hypothetical protein PC128_g2336 [Phytophthora cactorum]KAG4060052.1 hypothetical protein PC123_g5041 [Phytophthora cactorum]
MTQWHVLGVYDSEDTYEENEDDDMSFRQCTILDKWGIKANDVGHVCGAVVCPEVPPPRVTKSMREYSELQDEYGVPPRKKNISTTLFALYKSNALDTEVYTYRKATSRAESGQFDVGRVPSGRWRGVNAFTTNEVRPMSSFEFLTEAEATSGIGTYVGSALCIARVPQGKSKVWDYGILVGYAWEEMFKTGVLQVTFLKETCEIPYNEDELQDLGLETYALRPLSCEIQLMLCLQNALDSQLSP